MSIKIKINWDDLNVISEGVRIYKNASAFTSSSLPAVCATVAYGVDEFEDLDVVENQTYFYMLSCFLGEQEVFTECYEVLAELDPVVEFSTPKIESITTSQEILSYSNTNVSYLIWAIFNQDGSELYVPQDFYSTDQNIKILVFSCNNFQLNSPLSHILHTTPIIGRYIRSVYFFKNGDYAVLSVTKAGSIHKIIVVKLSKKFSLIDMQIVSETSASASQYCPSENGDYLFEITATKITRHMVSGSLLSSFTLNNHVDYSASSLTGYSIELRSLKLDINGGAAIIVAGGIAQAKVIVSFKLTTPFDLSTISQRTTINRGTTSEVTGQNSTNRFFYGEFLLLSYATTTINNLYKLAITFTNWV